MSYKYQTNFQVSSVDGSEKIELRNPANSGYRLELLKLGIVSDAEFSVFGLRLRHQTNRVVRRYDALATHDGPTAVTEYEWDPAGPSPAGQVFWGADATIDFQGSVDFAHDEQLDSSDGGDDAEVIPAKYFPGSEQIVIPEGCSLRLILPPDAQSDYKIKFVWQEVPVS
jgi:hypothetical protein